MSLFVLDHPLIQNFLAILRDKRTSVRDFRRAVSEISSLMFYEAARDLPVEYEEIETPVSRAVAGRISDEKLVIVPILRAGLGMVNGILAFAPGASVGNIGLYRDPITLNPVEYYNNLPRDIDGREAIIVDPVVATGGNAAIAIQKVKLYGCRKIKLLSIVASSEGLEKLRRQHPDVDIYLAAVDDSLDEQGFIIPGLGDAGDRIYGTE